jgi:hypothetical protein
MQNDSVITENIKLRKMLGKNKAPQAGNSRAAYMRDYRKRKLVEKYICNNVPN